MLDVRPSSCYTTLSPVDECLTVGAMAYLSPTLTMLMLAVVPPVSLGAVGFAAA